MVKTMKLKIEKRIKARQEIRVFASGRCWVGEEVLLKLMARSSIYYKRDRGELEYISLFSKDFYLDPRPNALKEPDGDFHLFDLGIDFEWIKLERVVGDGTDLISVFGRVLTKGDVWFDRETYLYNEKLKHQSGLYYKIKSGAVLSATFFGSKLVMFKTSISHLATPSNVGKRGKGRKSLSEDISEGVGEEGGLRE